MNSFGLGLILNFTDNATSGLQGATGAFNNLNNSITALANSTSAEEALMRLSATAGIVGNSLYGVGQNLTSMFTGITQNVIDTGGTVASALTQLSTLYGEAGVANYEAGQEILDQIKEYSAKSIFNFEDLIPSVIMLKANGIEAFNEIASSTGNARQTLMDYAADLAAFNPNMRNAYGTGVQAAMGALNEYIAEGNATSLKRGASLDILQLLGEEKGETIEERSRQVADLIEQLGMVGMTANLAGQPMQRLSNVEDIFFNLMTEISNSGVYEKYSALVKRLTDYLFSIDEDELTNLAQVISDTLTELMGLLDYVLDVGIKVVDWLRNLVKENPELTKMIIKGTALAGVFALIAGAGLKLLSSLGMLRFSLSMMFKGGVANSLKLLGVFKSILLYVAPLIAMSTLIRKAWESDIGGIQEKVKSAVKNIWESLSLIFDAFTDNTLSEDNFERAKKLGLLPLIEALLQIKYHWEFFVEGFKKGIAIVTDIVGKVINKVIEFIPKVGSLRDKFVAFLEKITAPGLTDVWEKVGEVMGQIVGWLVVALAIIPPAIKLIKIIIGVLKIVWNVGKAIFNVLKFIWGVLKVIAVALQAIGFLAALPVEVVAIIVAAIIGLIALVWHFRDEIAAFLVETWWKIEAFFKNLWTIIVNSDFVQSLISGIKSAIDWIVNAYNTVKDFIIGVWNEMIDFWANLFESIDEFFTGIKEGAVNFYNKAVEVIQGIWEEIQNNPVYKLIHGFFHMIFGFIYMIWSALVVFFTGLIEAVVTLAKGIYNAITSAWNGIKNFVVGVWNEMQERLINFWTNVAEVVSFIADFIGNAIHNIAEFIKGIIQFVTYLFTSLYEDYIVPITESIVEGWQKAVDFTTDHIITPAVEFVTGVVKGIGEIITWLRDDIFGPAFETIHDTIVGAIESAYEVVKPIFEAIGNAISSITEGIGNFIENVGGFFEGAGDFFKGVGDYTLDMVGLSTGGYVNTEGIAVLHPNEVVVNDVLTQRLGAFLSDYESNKATPKEQSVLHSDNSDVLLNGIKSAIESGVHSLIDTIKALNISPNTDKVDISKQVSQLLNNVSSNQKVNNDLMIKGLKTFLDSLINVVANKDINIDISELYNHSEDSAQKLFNAIQYSTDKLGSIVSNSVSALNNSDFIDSVKVLLENTSQKFLSKSFDVQVTVNNDIIAENIISGTNIINASLNQVGGDLFNELEVLKTELIKGLENFQPIQEVSTTPNIQVAFDSESIIGHITEVINTIQLSIIQVGDKILNGLNVLTSEIVKGVKSPLIEQDIIATDDYSERADSNPIPPYNPKSDDSGSDNTSPIEEITNYTTTENETVTNTSGDTYIDNSVTFTEGSIVFNIDKDTDISNLSDEELRVMADKIFAIISRKLQIRSMQTRK